MGKVKARAWLEQQGAEIVETSMLLGEAAYDVAPGWMGVPVGAFSERAAEAGPASSKGKKGGKKATKHGPPKTDEELLARFLAKNL